MASASQDKAISVTLGGEGSNEAVTGAPTRLSQNRTKPRRDFFFFFFKETVLGLVKTATSGDQR